MWFFEGYVWYGGCGICGVYLCVVEDVLCGGWYEMQSSVVCDVCIYICVYLCIHVVCVGYIRDMECLHVCV